MVQLDFRSGRSRAGRAASAKSRDFSNLQRTRFEADKEGFNSFGEVLNMIHKGGNARLRRGYSSLLSDSDLLGVHLYEQVTANLLYATKVDGASNSKVVKVDRSDGTLTDIFTGRTGQGSPSAASLNGFFYWVNGSDDNIVSYDEATTTTNTTLNFSASELVRLLAADESRLWGVFVDSGIGSEILRFSTSSSTGEIQDFSGTGTAVNRGGIANSLITKFTAILGVGKYIVACGKNRTEVHKIPDFSGTDTFQQGVSTLVFSFPNLGIPSQFGLVQVDKNVYFLPEDGTLVRINVETGEKQVFRQNFRSLEGLDVSNAALGYDQKNNLVLAACSASAVNDKVIAFNHEENNFSEFDNVFADQWIQDADNVYFYNSRLGVFDAFKDTQKTDNGSTITAKVRTQATDFGTLDAYKNLIRVFANVEVGENVEMTIRVYKDRGVNSGFSPAFETTVSLDNSINPLGESSQSFGAGTWGGAGIDTEVSTMTEFLRTTDYVNIEGVRFEVELEAEVRNEISIRGIGAYFYNTSKLSNNLTYS